MTRRRSRARPFTTRTASPARVPSVARTAKTARGALAAGRATTVAAAVLLGAGCGEAPDGSGVVRTDSAGVEIVLNPGADRPAPLALERRFSLGGHDDGPEAFFNLGPGSVAAGHDGRLYVLDRGNHRVVVFDAHGRHARTFGRQGGGPGELQWPQVLVVADDGTLLVADIGHHGLVRFGPAGDPLDVLRLDGWLGGLVRPFGDAILAQVRRPDQPASHDRLVVLSAAGQEEREIVTIEGGELRPVDLGCVRISGMSRLFDPTLVWTAGPDRVAFVPGPGYDIRIHDGRRVVASVRRDIPARPATRDLAVQEVGEVFRVQFGGGGGCEASPDRVVDERGFAPTIPAIRTLAIAPDGTLWVRRFAVRGDSAPIDLFAHDGAYLGTLPPDSPFPVAFFPDGAIIALDKDDLDLDHIVVYDVRTPAG